MRPLPPIDAIAQAEGGGAPNDADSAVVGAKIHPASISPNLNDPVKDHEGPEMTDGEVVAVIEDSSASVGRGCPVVRPDTLVAYLESQAPEDEDAAPLPVTWEGEPTKGALRRLRREAWTPAFDADLAFAVFQGVSEGKTVRQVCSQPGYPRRWEVVAWRAMVPAYEELMAAAELALGAEYRDRGVEAMDSDRPDDRASAQWLKLAAAYDRRIAKGTEDAGSGSITVNLANFGGG